MGSAGDLVRCMMYTSVGVPIVLPDDSIQYLLAPISNVWMSNMYLFSLHAVAAILTWEAARNYCTVLSALSGYCEL